MRVGLVAGVHEGFDLLIGVGLPLTRSVLTHLDLFSPVLLPAAIAHTISGNIKVLLKVQHRRMVLGGLRFRIWVILDARNVVLSLTLGTEPTSSIGPKARVNPLRYVTGLLGKTLVNSTEGIVLVQLILIREVVAAFGILDLNGGHLGRMEILLHVVKGSLSLEGFHLVVVSLVGVGKCLGVAILQLVVVVTRGLLVGAGVALGGAGVARVFGRFLLLVGWVRGESR